MIRDELDYQRHVDYIHYNPVKNGYANKAVNWSYSSIHRFIVFGKGFISSGWSVGKTMIDIDFGER